MISTSKDRLKSEQSSRSDVARRVSQTEAQLGMTPYGWDHFARLRHDFDWLFGRYFGAWPTTRERDARESAWGLDLRETEDAVVVDAEAPGFEPSDFDIEVRDDRLVMKAMRKHEGEDPDLGLRTWKRQELYRVVPLPAAVDPDKIEATYRNGILTVTLPRSEKATRRRIAVRG